MDNETKFSIKQKLQELVDVSILQHIQDWFVVTTGVSASIRDSDGKLVTRPTRANEFCNLVRSTLKGRRCCERSNVLAVQSAKQTKGPVKYVCHAGLLQYAAPIEVGGRCVGSIVLGDQLEGPLDPQVLERLARSIGVDPRRLKRAAAKIPRWSEEQMGVYVKFLHVLANMVASLCYQGHQLRQRVREMTVLLEVTRLLTSTLNLQQVLDLIVRKVTEVLAVKACSLRLLDPTGTELVIKAVHNLSPQYLNKGPVILEQSAIDRAAMQGEVVFVRDLLSDPRVLYPREAKREGLRSSLAVALRYQDKPIGVLHVYTATPHEFDPQEIALFRALADVAATAIENARLYQESLEKQQLEKELNIAASIQNRLIPATPPRFDRIQIDARSVQSKRVGGDFYDFIPINDSMVGIAIADVSGKGVPGALLMATARSALRALIENGGRMVTTAKTHLLIRRLNYSLCRDTGSDEFVTLFFGQLDARNLTFTYTNAGHNSPLLLRRGKLHRLDTGGMVLGVSEDAAFEQEQIHLQRGDMLVLYTDGVTDARNRHEEVFGEERLKSLVTKLHANTAAQVVETIHLEVEEFSEDVPQFDDRTVMVIKVT